MAEGRHHPAKPPNRMALTCTLDFEMAQRKLTNVMLAEMTGVHRSSIAKLRRNTFLYIDAKALEKICLALKLQPGDLLHIESDT
jgi:putative transcriptional regulator